jgi:hypothetical protein
LKATQSDQELVNLNKQPSFSEKSMSNKSDSVIRYAIASVLQDGESVVWSGIQDRKRLSQAYILKGLIPMFFTFGMIGVMTNATFSWTNIAKWERIQWAAVLLASLGPLGLIAALIRFNTQQGQIYVVTNRRAVVISGKHFHDVASYSPDQLGKLIRTERKDGTGDIEFERVREIDSTGEVVIHLHGFYGIHQPREVEQHISDLYQIAFSHQHKQSSSNQ